MGYWLVEGGEVGVWWILFIKDVREPKRGEARSEARRWAREV